MKFLTNLDQRSYALKYILHLIGDIHQPLHVGVKEDLGGNMLQVKLPSEDTCYNLHEMWDWVLRVKGTEGLYWELHADRLIRGTIDTDHRKEFIERFIHPSAFQSLRENVNSESVFNFASYLARETFEGTTCKIAYMHAASDTPGGWISNKDRLSPQYMTSRLHTVESLLIKAGARLAFYLDVLSLELRKQRRLLEKPLIPISQIREPGALGVPLNTGNAFASLADHVPSNADVQDESQSEREINPIEKIIDMLKNVSMELRKFTDESKLSPIVVGIDVRNLAVSRDIHTGKMVVISNKETLMKNGGNHGDLAISMLLTQKGDSESKWGSECVPVGIDRNAFKEGLSNQVIQRLVDYEKRNLVETTDLDRMDYLFGTGYIILNEEVMEKMYLDKFDDWLVLVIRKNFLVLMSRRNAKEERKSRVFKFNLCSFDNKKGMGVDFFVDVSLADEWVPFSIRRRIIQIAEDQTKRESKELERQYPKLVRELTDLYAMGRGLRHTGALGFVQAQKIRKDKPYLSSIGYVGTL